MTEKKEQITPEIEPKGVNQEQVEVVRPAIDPKDVAQKHIETDQPEPETEDADQAQTDAAQSVPDSKDSDIEKMETTQSSPKIKDGVREKQVGATQEKAGTNKVITPKKKQRRKIGVQLEQVVGHFAACGRCSYFLSGYRVIHGVENLGTAVNESKAGWLTLSWNHPMRDLLSKSFGIQLTVDYYHYDGCCPECGRHYTYQAGEKPIEAATLRVQIRNRR